MNSLRVPTPFSLRPRESTCFPGVYCCRCRGRMLPSLQTGTLKYYSCMSCFIGVNHEGISFPLVSLFPTMR